MKKGAAVAVTVLLLAIPTLLQADPIVGAGASTGPKGMLIVEPHFQYFGYTEMYSAEMGGWMDFPPGMDAQFEMLLLQVTYGISERVWPRINIPYWWRDVNLGQLKGTSNGLGDIVLDVKTKLIKGENLQQGLVLLTGLRLPTGDTDKPGPLSLGDGSIDYGGGLTASKRFGPVQLSGMAAWWFCEVNDFGDGSDELEYNISAQILASRKVIPNVELYGRYTEGGEKRSLELILGVQYWPKRKLLLEAAVRIPVDTKGGFKYDAAPYVGLMALF